MIEPERAQAAAKAAYNKFKELTPEMEVAPEWDTLGADVQNDWLLVAIITYQAFVDARPGMPCTHVEWFDTGRCGEMYCSNYAEKHRNPAGYGRIE
jgi:hypothetical protein